MSLSLDIDELHIPRHVQIQTAIGTKDLEKPKSIVVPSRRIVTQDCWDRPYL